MAIENPRTNGHSEQRLTREAREIIALFRSTREATDEKMKESLFKEFAQKLVEIITPKGQKPHVGEQRHYMKGITEGTREGVFYIGSGTSGQRILFENYASVKRDDTERLKRWERGARKVDAGNYIELESIDGQPRWMRYPKPGDGKGRDWKFGREYWERYMETFGEEVVDLLGEFGEQ